MDYRKGYKIQIAADVLFPTLVTGYDVETMFLKLVGDGTLTVKRGYACDGCSGPTIDTPKVIPG